MPEGTRRRASSGRSYEAARRATGQMYVQGSAARRLREMPDYVPGSAAPKRKRQSSREVTRRRIRQRQINEATIRNRQKATGIGRGYIVFLAVVLGLIMCFCAYYLQLQNRITQRMQEVATLESQLSTLREDNDEYYSQVTSNIDLTNIKKIAIGRLGMRYPSEEQIVQYETEGKSYVRQYQDVPNH